MSVKYVLVLSRIQTMHVYVLSFNGEDHESIFLFFFCIIWMVARVRRLSHLTYHVFNVFANLANVNTHISLTSYSLLSIPCNFLLTIEVQPKTLGAPFDLLILICVSQVLAIEFFLFNRRQQCSVVFTFVRFTHETRVEATA